MTTVQIAVISLQEFMERYSDEGPFEYIDGEFIPVAPQVARSGRVGGRFFRRFADHVEENELGEVFVETPFVLTLDNSNWVKGSRVPDVMYYSADKMKKLAEMLPDWEDYPLVGVPDFVAEVVSPTDKYIKVNAKVAQYLRDGVQLVWVIEPEEKSVTIYVHGSDQQTIVSDLDITLNMGSLVAGFSIKLNELF